MQALLALAVPALAFGFAPGALNSLPRAHARAATGASEITMRTPLMAGNWKVPRGSSLSRADAAARPADGGARPRARGATRRADFCVFFHRAFALARARAFSRFSLLAKTRRR